MALCGVLCCAIGPQLTTRLAVYVYTATQVLAEEYLEELGRFFVGASEFAQFFEVCAIPSLEAVVALHHEVGV